MTNRKDQAIKNAGISRRKFLKGALSGGALAASGAGLFTCGKKREWKTETLVAKAARYDGDIASLIHEGLKELGVSPEEIRGKNILLKPNMVETSDVRRHINTHPLVVRGAAEAFMSLGAARIIVGEGPGHRGDTLLALEESGLADVLFEDKIPFIDFNYDMGYTVQNAGGHSRLATLTFPSALREVDWIVSMPKMKTHHWAGVTLSMKNLFGVMPGIYYGWPKNVLHWEGIEKAIFDINATLRPHFAIVDGIVGMEGDGPIMGSPRNVGALVMGRNLAAVDATCARIMGINPHRIPHLAAASGRLGPIGESYIIQRGEPISSVRADFELLEKIPAHRGLRL